jgi:nucleoside-diphosphate-sugar epimerase
MSTDPDCVSTGVSRECSPPFLRTVRRGGRLEIFGDGRQLRDPVYVDDVVDAFLLIGKAQFVSRSFNIGGPAALTLAEIAVIVSAAAGVSPPVFRGFPPEAQSIDIGSYCSDSSRIRQELGWEPSVPFVEGIARTLAYYRVESGMPA